MTHNDGLTAVEQIYSEVNALQLIWSDSHGHLPWEDGFNNPPERQPFLGPLPETWTVDDAT